MYIYELGTFWGWWLKVKGTIWSWIYIASGNKASEMKYSWFTCSYNKLDLFYWLKFVVEVKHYKCKFPRMQRVVVFRETKLMIKHSLKDPLSKPGVCVRVYVCTCVLVHEWVWMCAVGGVRVTSTSPQPSPPSLSLNPSTRLPSRPPPSIWSRPLHVILMPAPSGPLTTAPHSDV